MTTHTETRRGLIRAATYGAGAAIVIAAAKITDAVGETPAADRTAWDQAFAELQRAKVAAKADDAQFDRIHEAWQRTAPSADMIHWGEFPFEDRVRIERYIDIDQCEAHFLTGEGDWWFGENTKARKLAAFQSVRDYRALCDTNDALHGIDDAGERNDEMGERLSVAEDILLRTPAPDHPALAWKLKHLLSLGIGKEPMSTMSWPPCMVAQTLADIDRLCGAEIVA